MQDPYNKRQSLWKLRLPDLHVTHYLYDGLPPAARELLSRSTDGLQSIARKGGCWPPPWRVRNAVHSNKVSRTKLLLVVLWILTLWWGEKQVFRRHVARCRWDLWEQWGPEAHPHHLILLADPQLVDPHTYPGRPWPLSALSIRHTDQYLRRSFGALDMSLDPETVFFLGDLFDGGREWSTSHSKSLDSRWHMYSQDYWLGEYDRFGKVFLEPWKVGTALKGNGRNRRLIASLPGNHDLGFGNGIRLPVRRRFHTFFGHGDRIDAIGNHTFVSIDAVSLSAKSQMQPLLESPDPALWETSEAFLSDLETRRNDVIDRALRIQRGQLENALQSQAVHEIEDEPDQHQWTWSVPEDRPKLPTIVLSHVPFYRQPDKPCGHLRERWPPTKTGSSFDPESKDRANSILVAYGHQYQNVLSETLSQEIIRKVGNVKYIFSGDDHDYCDVLHMDLSSNVDGVPEITVKSTSWAMGVRKPGFLLVSLWNPVDVGSRHRQLEERPSIQTHLCLLPDQLSIFLRYAMLLAATMVILAIRAFAISGRSRMRVEALLPLPVSTPTFSVTDKPARGRADSASYVSSANSNDCNGLAVRSNAGRSRPLSPAYGYGFTHEVETSLGTDNGSPTDSSYLSSIPEETQTLQESRPSSAQKNKEGSPYPPSSHGLKPVSQNGVRLSEFLFSFLQVGTIAILWYGWLAYSI